ncbi:hypothetical protein KP509_24G068600 [Ceratopteris richardii]|nr:hypothetical protein KP509_24G068600 [Ceratopteris richardii]
MNLGVEAWNLLSPTQTADVSKSFDIPLPLNSGSEPIPSINVSVSQNPERRPHQEMLQTRKPIVIDEEMKRRVRWLKACAMAHQYIHEHQACVQKSHPHDALNEPCSTQDVAGHVQQHEPHKQEVNELSDLRQRTGVAKIYRLDDEQNPEKRHDSMEGSINKTESSIDHIARLYQHHAYPAEHDNGKGFPQIVGDRFRSVTISSNSSIIHAENKHPVQGSPMGVHCPLYSTTKKSVSPRVSGRIHVAPVRDTDPPVELQDFDHNEFSTNTLRDSPNANAKPEIYSSSSNSASEVICVDDIVNPTQAAEWFGIRFLCTSTLVS